MEILHLRGPAPLSTNTFLVTDGKVAAAIDPAAAPQEYLRLLKERGLALTHILLTHGHYDHVGAVEALRAATGAAVYLAKEDAQGGRLFPFTTPDEDYRDGMTVPVGELAFTVYRTPGHSPGSVCLLCGDALFSGDTLFAGDIGRTDLAGGSMDDMQRSRKSCAAPSGRTCRCCPATRNFPPCPPSGGTTPTLRPTRSCEGRPWNYT